MLFDKQNLAILQTRRMDKIIDQFNIQNIGFGADYPLEKVRQIRKLEKGSAA
jgi:hypothetical protein